MSPVAAHLVVRAQASVLLQVARVADDVDVRFPQASVVTQVVAYVAHVYARDTGAALFW